MVMVVEVMIMLNDDPDCYLADFWNDNGANNIW